MYHHHLCSFPRAVLCKSLLAFRRGPTPPQCPVTPSTPVEDPTIRFRSPAILSSWRSCRNPLLPQTQLPSCATVLNSTVGFRAFPSYLLERPSLLGPLCNIVLCPSSPWVPVSHGRSLVHRSVHLCSDRLLSAWHFTVHYYKHTHTHTLVSSHVFTSPCLVEASTGGRSFSSGFPNCPRPQLLDFNSNSSEQLNPSGYLTHSLTHQPNFTNS
jgi:hypothetical protein